MTTAPSKLLDSLKEILHKCPYRQHSPACRPFHEAMNTAKPKILALLTTELERSLREAKSSAEPNSRKGKS